LSLPRHLRETIVSELSGKRLFLDVSVLLAGLLDPGCASQQLLEVACKGTVVLSGHVEDMARTVVRANAPGKLPEFDDALLRLGAAQTIERIRRCDLAVLDGEALKLSKEDQQVLADAIGGRADILATHDAKLFRAVPSGLQARSPSSITWSPDEATNVERGGDEMTFIGFFAPQWSSDAVAGSDLQFYYFEVAGFARAFYDARSSEACLEWMLASGGRGRLRMPQRVESSAFHFVAAAFSPESVQFFVDGVTRGRRARIAMPAGATTFHPFMSAQSQHQINGGCHFRVEPRSIREGELRRLWASRSTRLSDGELRFTDWAAQSPLIVTPSKPRILRPPA
jgi:predicted nucleic acid-binding protein